MSFPFFGEEFKFTQPDGTQIPVRGWGDQNHAHFETLDGFTVVRDPQSGFYHYAMLSPEGDQLKSTSLRVGQTSPQALNLPSGVRINRTAGRTLAENGNGLPIPRWRERHDRSKAALRSASTAAMPLTAPPPRQTLGKYQGLCLLIQFPDMSGTITQDEVERFCNQPGYGGFGNHGSIHDYYRDNSVGKLEYKTVVAPYYTAQHPRDYYTNPSVPFGTRARELTQEALAWLVTQRFSFSDLSVDNESYVFATNVFYAGQRVNNWSQGLWPHSSRLLVPYQLAPGVFSLDYQITNIGEMLTLGTYCHENGHMLCDFPDLYDYADSRLGVGYYCLMCQGGNANPLNPAQICAYLKYRAGWASLLTPISKGMKVSAAATQNHFFIHRNNNTEYFLIENRNKTGRDEALTDSGLTIWHIDEQGSNSAPDQAPLGHRRFECVLVEADGRTDLENGANQGDNTDLFRNGFNARFADNTVPSSKWWDGTSSNLTIDNVGPAGQTIPFNANV